MGAAETVLIGGHEDMAGELEDPGDVDALEEETKEGLSLLILGIFRGTEVCGHHRFLLPSCQNPSKIRT